ncbi:MAG: hypothetical protein A2Y13_04110 [Planctomycetes bacterium GWC2_45_44]|nr:MAG: hypothetical protein A2Y13_04110 [Planctomycetes bacterium GWC2_45_44]HBR19877.1 hypothetical protein [Phycisphaerales bacterium]
MTTDFTTLFVNVDDCWKAFEKIYAKYILSTFAGIRKESQGVFTAQSTIGLILEYYDQFCAAAKQ